MFGLIGLFSLPQASTMAPRIDALYDFIFWVSLVSFIIIVGALIVFVFRYHRKNQHPEKTPYIDGHTPVELGVAIILFVIVMVIFAWGWIDYAKIIRAPNDALEINITGRQWLWEVEYTNGRKLVNELVVPKGKPVSLIMGSADVIHSFYVPAFRLKQDVVPGAYTKLWFEATTLGEFPAYCAEYCGTAHSGMIAKLRVVEPEEYDRWTKIWELEQHLGVSEAEAATEADTAQTADSMASRGEKLFTTKGCNACHTTTGASSVGPTLKGLFGRETSLDDGSKVNVDENYLRESIMDPQLKMVKGFQPVMPTYRGQLTDDEVNGLIAFIKKL